MLGLDEELASIAARLRRSTVQVIARGGHGSGLITSADGVAVTNAHVANGKRPRVVLADGRELIAEVMASAPERDLAALRFTASGLTPAEFRDAPLRQGELVIAVGNPLDLVGAVTTGIVHSVDRKKRSITADLALLPGNSGGPLADAAGKVVGVNAMVVDGLAVAIAAPVVKRFLAAPFVRPYLGVVTRAVNTDVMGDRRLGLLITEVVERSAADRGGVLPGDVVIGADGRLFTSPNDLYYEIETASVGASIRLDVVRNARVRGLGVVIGDAAGQSAAA